MPYAKGTSFAVAQWTPNHDAYISRYVSCTSSHYHQHYSSYCSALQHRIYRV